ncbi:hypothetical protein DITRI_Ditri12bG0016300 [Diplodiscus trichospermus]
MWGLISMFDFRHGRSTQRLLSDRKRGDRNVGGMRNSRNKLDMLTSSGDNCTGTLSFVGKSIRKESIVGINGQPDEGHMQPNQKSSGSEERLSEAIEFLVSQKLINTNQLTENGELQASKQVMDALQILSSDEALFLKLLQDPNSLVKYVQSLLDAQG